MITLDDFLKHLQKACKGKKSFTAEEISEFIVAYANQKNEPFRYELPNGKRFEIGKPYEAQLKSPKYSPQMLEQFTQFLALLETELPSLPCIKLKPVRGETTVFDTKLGGVPYLPKDFEYPRTSAGDPLKLLVQLNFGRLPHIGDFPEKGILQMFAGSKDDDVVGVDFDDYFHQDGFRIIYHENIIEDETQLISQADMPEFDYEDYAFPFEGEFLLQAELSQMFPTTEDYRFEKACVNAYNQVFHANVEGMWSREEGKGIHSVNEEFYDLIYDALSKGGSHIGGYPYFTQEDPRGWNENYAKCDVLLFQLDSEYDGKDEIIWGDSGVGNFFISREDLRKRDFSRVLYTWDCC